MKSNSKLEFLLSEYEERFKNFRESIEKKTEELADASKRLEIINKKADESKVVQALDSLREVLGDPAPDITEEYIRMRQKNPDLFVRMRTITISAAKGIKAVIGWRPDTTGSEIQSYLFDKKKWTVTSARKWIAEHKTSSAGDAVLIEKLSTLNKTVDEVLIEKLQSLNKVFLTDAIVVDEFTETPEGVTFHNVVFAKEIVQEYTDGKYPGKHYKPANELKKALEYFRGKPAVPRRHPYPEKVVTNPQEQIGFMVFDKVFWDGKKNRVYGDVFIKKEPRTLSLIEEAKKKKVTDVSIGFRTKIVKESGVFNGIPYDYIQKDFFIDHLAFGVRKGRATSEDGVGIYAY